MYVFERTDSTTWIALVTAAGWIPRLLMSGYGGVLADRYERTRVMVVSSVLAFFASASALAIVVATDGPLVLILVLAAATSTVATPYNPAAGALTPEVVPERDLTAANGLFSALENLVVVIGPVMGALLLAAAPGGRAPDASERLRASVDCPRWSRSSARCSSRSRPCRPRSRAASLR